MRAALTLVALAACADISGFDGDPQMNPGQSCLSCHSAGHAASGLTFNLAGTVYALALASADGGVFNARVSIRQASGQMLELTSNGAGNFYSAEPIDFPVTVAVEAGGTTFTMQQSPPTGDCNSCHTLQPSPDGAFAPASSNTNGFSSAPGRIYAFASDAGCPNPPSSCAASVPSFADQVGPILEGTCLPCHLAPSSCATTALEDGGACGLEPELDTYATIASADFSLALGCLMPPPSAYLVSPDELQTIVAWLSCGSPNN